MELRLGIRDTFGTLEELVRFGFEKEFLREELLFVVLDDNEPVTIKTLMS